MEQSFTLTARQILQALTSRGSCLFGGVIPGEPEIHVQVESGPGTLCYACNLGLHQPTRSRAEEMLAALVDHGRQLEAASPEYRVYSAGRTVSARLYVDSGPMDFPVAEKTGETLVWHYPLPEA